MEEPDTRFARVDGQRNRVHLTMEISRFRLPPVSSALVIGKRTGIGPKAMEKALAEMLPEAFELVPVEHPTIEAVLIRSMHLRRVPKDRLVQLIVRQAENLMDESEMLHFDLDVKVHTSEELEL